MGDIFLEQIVKRKQTIKVMATKALILTLAFVLILLVLPFPFINIVGTIIVAWLAYYFFTNQNVEYEYIFTSGELDFDKVLNKRKRKKVTSIDAKSIIIMAPALSSEHKSEFNSYSKKYDCSSGEITEKTYVIMISRNKNKIKILFEPNNKILEAIKSYAPRNVHLKQKVN
ncbi:MAG: DUF6106 family protein [Eubacteriales bacterium]